MAKVNFNEINASGSTTYANNDDYSVKFFKLNNGEDAIVRIMIDSAEDFDIRTVHKVALEGYQYGKNVNCIMEGNNPNTCPLCATGNKINQRLYIRMIKYEVVNGAIVPTPVVWERSVFDKVFGTQALVDCIRDYGALSDLLCRISRRGEGLNTVYSVTFALNLMPATKAVYRDELYPKDSTLFGDFDVLGISIMDKNYDELTHFVQNGYFPERVKETASTPTDVDAPPASNSYGNGFVNTPMAQGTAYAPTATQYAPPTTPTINNPPINVATPRTAPQWGNTPNGSEGGFNRPQRY